MKSIICTINSEPILVTDIKRVGNYIDSGTGEVNDSIYITGINLDTNELKNIKLESSTESYTISTSAYIQNT